MRQLLPPHIVGNCKMKQLDTIVLREFLSFPLENADKVFEKFQTITKGIYQL